MRVKGNHFAEGGGVHTRLMGFTDISYTLVGMRYNAVDERRFPYTTVPTEQGNLSFQQGAQFLNALSCCR